MCPPWLARPWLVPVVVIAAVALSGCCLCDSFFGNFNRYECRAKQSEAKSNLKSLYIAQSMFQAERSRFGTLEEIGFAPAGETLRYEYVLVSHDDTHFVAEARGKDEMTGDLWQIDDTGTPRALQSVCGPVPESEGDGSAPIEVMRPERDPTDALELRRAVFQVRY